MSFLSMSYCPSITSIPGGRSRMKDRVRRLRMALRRPHLEWLEERIAPAVALQFDYTFDNSGFFTTNPAAKTVLQQAGQLLGNALQDNLTAIVPSVGLGNTWTANFTN